MIVCLPIPLKLHMHELWADNVAVKVIVIATMAVHPAIAPRNTETHPGALNMEFDTTWFLLISYHRMDTTARKNPEKHWMQHFTLVTKHQNILCVTTDRSCYITIKNQTPWKIQCFINTYEKQLLSSNLDLCPNFYTQLKMRVVHAEGTTPNIQMQKLQQHWCT